MQHTRGRYIIFADADGASKFEDLGKLSNQLKRVEKDGLGVAVGSRAHMVHSAAVVQVPPFPRELLQDCDSIRELIVALVHSKLPDVRLPYISTFHWHSINKRHPMRVQIIHSTSLCSNI